MNTVLAVLILAAAISASAEAYVGAELIDAIANSDEKSFIAVIITPEREVPEVPNSPSAGFTSWESFPATRLITVGTVTVACNYGYNTVISEPTSDDSRETLTEHLEKLKYQGYIRFIRQDVETGNIVVEAHVRVVEALAQRDDIAELRLYKKSEGIEVPERPTDYAAYEPTVGIGIGRVVDDNDSDTARGNPYGYVSRSVAEALNVTAHNGITDSLPVDEKIRYFQKNLPGNNKYEIGLGTDNTFLPLAGLSWAPGAGFGITFGPFSFK
jgi:hypothetical protein